MFKRYPNLPGCAALLVLDGVIIFIIATIVKSCIF